MLVFRVCYLGREFGFFVELVVVFVGGGGVVGF